MGVIELYGELGVEVAGTEPLAAQDAEHVLQRAAHEEDLLAQPQPLALIEFVVGVENLAEGLALHLGQHGPGVVTGVEGGEVEGFRRHRRPQPQGVGRAHAVAGNRRVVGDADHGAVADLHRVAPFRANHLPGVTEGEPGIGALVLPVGADALAKDAELVANAVADCGQLQAGQ